MAVSDIVNNSVCVCTIDLHQSKGNTLSLNARDVNQLLVDVEQPKDPPGRGRLRCRAYLTDSATRATLPQV